MSHTIYAAFADSEHAERASGALLDHGVRAEDLSIVRGNREQVLTADDGTPISTTQSFDDAGDIESQAKNGISTTSAADAGAGALVGAGWGAGIGAIAALTSLVVPGFGLVIGGGALAAALGAFAASTGAGAVAGAVTGYLKDQGVDEDTAAHYERTIGEGGALIAITLPSGNVDELKAREILNKYGAANVNSFAARGYVS